MGIIEYFKTAIILLDSPDILWYGSAVCYTAKIPFILLGSFIFLTKAVSEAGAYCFK
jgi:hypothetical protein